jgi:hypothetical protein
MGDSEKIQKAIETKAISKRLKQLGFTKLKIIIPTEN